MGPPERCRRRGDKRDHGPHPVVVTPAPPCGSGCAAARFNLSFTKTHTHRGSFLEVALHGERPAKETDQGDPMKRSFLIVLVVAVVAVAGWAQDAAGDRVPGEVLDGERQGRFYQMPDPEMLAQRAQAEVEIWDRYLSLTDEQELLVNDIVQAYFTNLAEFLSSGSRPDPASMQVLQEEKAFEIYEHLNAEQQAIMQYYYEEIAAEIFAAGRSGPGGGMRRPQ